MKKMSLLLLGFALLAPSFGNAQADAPLVIGERVSIESTVLDEEREIWIATPPGYEESDAGYPVLYLLDGDSNFRHVSTTADFLATANRIPGLIVVAILNTDRGRDMTPASTDPDDARQVRTHGGADQFKVFLGDELIPYIDENYNTRDYRILVGHSLGGLFAMHTLTTQPEMFDAYLVVSPTLRWSDQDMVNQAERFLASSESLQLDLYMTIANETGESLSALRKLTGVLTQHSPHGLRWNYERMVQEHHGSVILPGTYNGLQSIFSGWSVEDVMGIYEIGGVAALREQYTEGGKRFGYDRSLSDTTLLQLASELIQQARLDEAAAIVLNDINMAPPSYFLNLLGERYQAIGNATRARQLYALSLQNNPGDEVSQTRLRAMGVDPSQLIDVVSVDEDVLNTYTGRYRLTPEFTLTVFVQEGKLYSQGTRQRATELVPLSQTRFSVTDGDSQIEFFADSRGTIDRLVLSQFGREMEAARLPDNQSGPESGQGLN